MNIPGKTISPNPSMLNFSYPQSFKKGNCNLIGMLRFLATETITSVPQTQNISQKKSAQRSINPTLKLLKLTIFNAIMLKSIPKTLFKAQCLVMKQQYTGIAAKKKARIEATERFISPIQRCFFRIDGTLMVEKFFLYFGGKGKRGTISSAVENKVVRQKQEVIRRVTTSALKYLQIKQIPNKKQEATIGNLIASFMPMVQLSPDQHSLSVNRSLLSRTCVLLIHPRQTTAQLLSSS